MKTEEIARRILAAADSRRLTEVFDQLDLDRLGLDEAGRIGRLVVRLRVARGDRRIGYKVGCVSPTVQKQFGLHRPVYGYLWTNEVHSSGCHLRHDLFARPAIEGEIAIRLRRDVPDPLISDSELSACVECWYPVIEIHHCLYRGAAPTIGELAV